MKEIVKKFKNFAHYSPGASGDIYKQIKDSTDIEYLKEFNDTLYPGHIRLMGRAGRSFARWAWKKHKVYINPTVEQLQSIMDEDKYYKEKDEQEKRNIIIQKEEEDKKMLKEYFEGLDPSEYIN